PPARTRPLARTSSPVPNPATGRVIYPDPPGTPPEISRKLPTTRRLPRDILSVAPKGRRISRRPGAPRGAADVWPRREEPHREDRFSPDPDVLDPASAGCFLRVGSPAPRGWRSGGALGLERSALQRNPRCPGQPVRTRLPP